MNNDESIDTMNKKGNELLYIRIFESDTWDLTKVFIVG